MSRDCKGSLSLPPLFHFRRFDTLTRGGGKDTAEKVFTRENGSSWDYVFNCGGDNRFSQDDEIYKQRSLQLSVTAAKEAAKRGVKCWVELSSGAVYKAEREPRKETDKLKPWVRLAKYKLEAEKELEKIEGYVTTQPMWSYIFQKTNTPPLRERGARRRNANMMALVID